MTPSPQPLSDAEREEALGLAQRWLEKWVDDNQADKWQVNGVNVRMLARALLDAEQRLAQVEKERDEATAQRDQWHENNLRISRELRTAEQQVAALREALEQLSSDLDLLSGALPEDSG